MSLDTLNSILRQAQGKSKKVVSEPAGTKSLDEILLSDLYTDSAENTATTTYITIVNGPGLSVGDCTRSSTCACASVSSKEKTALPVRFER